jgi:glycosyltransferase involved in cell wall biosynthesis
MAASILHVLPHPGGGGETYLRHLGTMEEFRFDRVALTEHRRPREVPGGIVRVARAIPGHDLVNVHGDTASLACWPLIGRGPTVITLHGCHLLRRSSGPGGAAVRRVARRVFARADAVIATSESELDFARAICPRASIELIRNGIPALDPPSEPERQRVRAELGLDGDDVAALFVGELAERKQPLQFAEAVRIVRGRDPRVVGLVAGEGPLRPALEPLQDDGLRLLGLRDDAERLLGAVDLFVLPSLWEGLPYSTLEAMALGRPALVSDGPGNPDAVGEAGLVFPAGDVAAMAEGLARLAGDAGLRASLGEAAARRARERFSLSGMTEATAAVYEAALARAGR